MPNIPELERRWLRYKLKSYLPYIFILLVLFIIITIIIIFMNSSAHESPSLESLQNSKKSIKTPVENLKVKIPTDTPKAIEQQSLVNNDITTLAPSMNFIKHLEHSSQPYYANNNLKNKKNLPVKQTKKKVEEIVLDTTPTQKHQEESIKEITHKISIKRKNTDQDILEIIARFKKSNNPTLSLFVAKKYYEIGNYHQSYNYALITNQINSEIEDSWIIFAKSLTKLGKKNMAIKTLQDYIRQSHSSSAQTLLDEIVLGKFK